MVSKNFEVGDLVWAKMKGFPPWPAKIIDPPSDSKSPRKKGQHYVFFFGSNNHAWIFDENIVPHTEEMVTSANKKKSSILKNAIECIVNFSKSIEKKNELSDLTKDMSATVEIDISEEKPVENPEHVEKTDVVKHSPKEQQSKKRADQKSSQKKRILRTKFKSFKRKYSCRDEGFNSLAYLTPVVSKDSFEQSLISPPIEISSEVVLKYKEPTEKRIGFLGLALLNRGILSHLLRSNHTVSVWAKSEVCDLAFGASKYSTPAEVVANSDIIFCCAVDSDAAKEIIFGKDGVLSALEECGEGKGCVLMTTVDPRTSEEFSEIIKRTGANYLEAPFSTSRKLMESGEVCILAAGDRSLFSDCSSCFHAIAKRVFFISQQIGEASKLNLINSMLNGASYAALAEALALAERLRVPDYAVLQVLQRGHLNCPGIIEKASAIVKRNFVTDVPLKNIQRDMTLALLLGGDVDRPCPVSAAANEVFKHAKLLKYSDYDVSAVYQGVKY